MHQATGAVFFAQSAQKLGGKAAFGRAKCVGVPLGRIAVAGGHKSRLSAHGQAYITRMQVSVHSLAQRVDGRPLVVGVRLGDAGRLINARDLHVVAEFHLAIVESSVNGRSARWLGRASQRNMPFACEQARCRVQPNPTRARQVHLAPSVQVGKVHFGPTGAINRLDIGLELNQVARYKACGHAQMPQHLHQQPAGVSA